MFCKILAKKYSSVYNVARKVLVIQINKEEKEDEYIRNSKKSCSRSIKC